MMHVVGSYRPSEFCEIHCHGFLYPPGLGEGSCEYDRWVFIRSFAF